MAFSQGNRSGLSYVTESTWGTTPGTPSLLAIPYTSHTLNLSKERVQGNDILSDRMVRTDRHGNRSVAGEMVTDLRRTDYDVFWESVFFNAWSTNVLKIGTTQKSFSIEDALTDITQFRLFTGMTVSSVAVSLKPNQMATASWSFVGKDMTISGTSVDAVKTAASGNAPADSYTGAVKIANAGSAPSTVANITGVDFTITNSLAPTFVVGSASSPQLEYGNAAVEGTITAYIEDATYVNRFINETETALEVAIDATGGGGVDYTFLFPRIKINGAEVPVDGPTSRIITMPFVGIYDTTENTVVKLTRVP
jgi:hypothetical protein